MVCPYFVFPPPSPVNPSTEILMISSYSKDEPSALSITCVLDKYKWHFEIQSEVSFFSTCSSRDSDVYGEAPKDALPGLDLRPERQVAWVMFQLRMLIGGEWLYPAVGEKKEAYTTKRVGNVDE